jgi:hypothetical protein
MFGNLLLVIKPTQRLFMSRWENNIEVDVEDYNGFVWFMTETSSRLCEHGFELSGFIKEVGNS